MCEKWMKSLLCLSYLLPKAMSFSCMFSASRERTAKPIRGDYELRFEMEIIDRDPENVNALAQAIIEARNAEARGAKPEVGLTRYDIVREGKVGDGVTDPPNSSDLDYLIKTFMSTFKGDANLDGIFNSSDLVSVFQAGQYEDDIPQNSNWATGDWNADGEF